jgi:hypothetical protein
MCISIKIVNFMLQKTAKTVRFSELCNHYFRTLKVGDASVTSS